jgi:outer membrane receptor protein involved in Fe transport
MNQIGSVSLSDRSKVEHNFSPEATVLYRPNADLTIYASYKRGYKGFGFNTSTFLVSTFAPGMISPFNGEKVEGFEGGIKASLMDRQLNVTLTPYWYKYKDLQVSFFDFATQTSIVGNAAGAKTRGVELGLKFTPRVVANLTVSGTLAYNDAKYSSYKQAPCWGGQVVATGCYDTVHNIQDLSGHRLYEAPQWVAMLGATYRFPVGDYDMELSGHVNYSSDYLTAADGLPGSRQDDYATVDASIRVGKLSGPWEIGIIGKNLTNKFYVISGNDRGTVIPGTEADAFGFVNRGRQVMLQVTFRPTQF